MGMDRYAVLEAMNLEGYATRGMGCLHQMLTT